MKFFCERCGKQRKTHLNKKLGGMLCDTCRRKLKTALCAICFRDRVVAGKDKAGNPLCRSCKEKVKSGKYPIK